jgi:hypothetical protein
VRGESLERRTLLSASIRGTAYFDANYNGMQDTNEFAGLYNISVWNDANSNGQIDSGEQQASTDGRGEFVLSSLAAGSYHLRAALATGTLLTSSVSGPTDVTLADGQDLTGVKFYSQAPQRPASISGYVYTDTNRNGQLDSGESPLANCRVYLDRNRNGIFDGYEDSTLTSYYGAYQFANISPGDYRVAISNEQWWKTTSPSTGYYDLNLVNGQNVGPYNLLTASAYVVGASLHGEVIEDLNGNGQRDSVEGALADVTVYADTNNNGAIDAGEPSVVTTANGGYEINNLPAGTYPMRAILAAGWTVSTAPTVTLPAQSGAWTYIGAQRIGGSIRGGVFNDLNGNGIQEYNENGVYGMTVYDDANNNGKFDAGERSTTSMNEGYYLEGLAAGTHKIRQVLQSG